MAIPKSTAKTSAQASAYLEIAVDIGSIGAASTLDVEITAPKAFRVGRAVLMEHDSALNAGVTVAEPQCLVVAGVKKIRFRATNATAGALDPASQTFRFLQL